MAGQLYIQLTIIWNVQMDFQKLKDCPSNLFFRHQSMCFWRRKWVWLKKIIKGWFSDDSNFDFILTWLRFTAPSTSWHSSKEKSEKHENLKIDGGGEVFATIQTFSIHLSQRKVKSMKSWKMNEKRSLWRRFRLDAGRLCCYIVLSQLLVDWLLVVASLTLLLLLVVG